MAESTSTMTMLSISPGSIVANRYEVVEQIGAGGMGLVYKVIDKHLNNEVVALKLLHPHLAQDEEVFARFRNEVLVARSLSHPNIVRIHDMGRAEQGFSYISMEYVDGYSLSERISGKVLDKNGKPFGPLSFGDALGVLYQILSGVAYAHDKDIIHRDLKPANVMVSSSGEIKLADFGTARILGITRGLTQTGQAIGTPDYMSPEQIQGKALDASSDIYALGIIAYELAVGQKPFNADTSVAIAYKHLHEPIPKFADEAKGIPEWFEQVVRKATAKDKEDRYPTAYEFARALSEHKPELSHQGTFFLADRTQFFRQTVREKSPTGTRPAIPAQETSADLAVDEEGFILGDSVSGQPGRVSSESWTTGGNGSAASAGSPAFLPAPRTAKTRRSTSPGILFLGAAGALFGLLVLAVRTLPAFNGYVGSRLAAMQTESGVDYSTLAAVLGVELRGDIQPLEADDGAKLAAADATRAAEREALSQELLSDLGVDESALAGQQSAGSSAAPAGGGAAGAKPAAAAAAGAEGRAAPSGEAVKSSGVETAGETAAAPEAAQQGPDSAPKPAQEAPSEKPTPPAKEVQVAKASTSPEPRPEPAVAAVEEKPEPPVPVSAKLLFRKGGEIERQPSFSVDALGAVHWNGEVQGLPKVSRGALGKLVREQFSVNVFSPDTASLVTKLDAELLQSGEGGSVRIGGDLRPLKRANVSSGEYRLDLVRNGEVLDSAQFSLYKASVVVSGAAGSAGASPVRIVTGAAVTGEQAANSSSPVVETLQPSSAAGRADAELPEPQLPGLASAGTAPGLASAAEPAPSGSLPTGSLPSAGLPTGGLPTGGLPPARHVEQAQAGSDASWNRSSLELARENKLNAQTANQVEADALQALSEPVQAMPAAEVFRGKLELESAGGAVDARGMSLSLRFTESEIQGSGSVEGFGEFEAYGKVYPRGLEINMRGASIGIRLTGVRRDNTLRGRYYIPSQQQRGSWEASMY